MRFRFNCVQIRLSCTKTLKIKRSHYFALCNKTICTTDQETSCCQSFQCV